jgi:hypothetical protein
MLLVNQDWSSYPSGTTISNGGYYGMEYENITGYASTMKQRYGETNPSIIKTVYAPSKSCMGLSISASNDWLNVIDLRRKYKDFKFEIQTGITKDVRSCVAGRCSYPTTYDNTTVYVFICMPTLNYCGVEYWSPTSSAILASSVPTGITDNNNFIQTIQCSGNNIKTFLNGVQQHNIIDTRITTEGYVGLYSLNGIEVGKYTVSDLNSEPTKVIARLI